MPSLGDVFEHARHLSPDERAAYLDGAAWFRCDAVLLGGDSRLATLPRLPGGVRGSLDGVEVPGSHRVAAVRAELLARAGERTAALAQLDAALAACDNDTERAHLQRRRAEISGAGIVHPGG